MKIEMSGTESVAAIRGDRALIAQLAVLERELLDRTRIFGLTGLRVVAGRDEQHGAAGGLDPNLMGIEAGIHRGLLLDRRTRLAVRRQRVDRDAARRVI